MCIRKWLVIRKEENLATSEKTAKLISGMFEGNVGEFQYKYNIFLH